MRNLQTFAGGTALNGVVVFVAVIMLLIGVLECFAGYKIRKVMVAIWGFFIGVVIGVVVGFLTQKVVLGIILAPLLGIAIAILAYKLYQLGIFFLAGGMSALMVFILTQAQSVGQTQSVIAVIVVGVLAGAFAVLIEKPTVIIATSISGAEILASSVCLLMISSGIRTLNNIVVVMYVLWIIFSITGMACQFITTSKTIMQRLAGSKKNVINPTLTYSERKYPGMQRAYRNFCINCGCALSANDEKCPSCGFQITDE